MEKKNGMTMKIAAVIGAVIGAATGVFLSDSKNRKKLAETAKHFKDEGSKYADDFKATARKVKKNAKEKVSETKDQLEE